ncbi:MAG: outer membrane lipoprotein-sorting protein [Candidatus Riflebacteria bacterium]|nr:outer membrane lipoprotein-sorting protein [Candidatus Riflebacteria bacterium]
MKINIIIVFILLFSLTLISGASSAPGKYETPDELKDLIIKVETQHRGLTSHGNTRMTIATKDWKRSLLMETWSEGRGKFLVRIKEPAKEKGTCTLKVENDIWNYFPKIDRLIKIPSSLMGDKWMGSHFTNDDLVKDNKIEELYDLKKEGMDKNIVIVQAVPKASSAVVWGKIIYRIDEEKAVPESVDYFDEAGKKVRTIKFDQVQLISGRWVALRMRVEPLASGESPESKDSEKSNVIEFTEMLFENIEFDLPVAPNLFSIRSLRK